MTHLGKKLFSRRDSKLIIIIWITISILAPVLTFIGPKPHHESSSSLISSSQLYLTLQEPTDTLIWLLWIATSLLLVVYLITGSRRKAEPAGEGVQRLGVSMLLVSGCLMALVFTSILWSLDFVQYWPQFGVSEVVIGCAVAFALYRIWALDRAPRRIANYLLGGVLSGILLFSLLQTPAHSRDSYHVQFTLDEILAVGAGRIPLGDFFPQYTNILGIPIAPIVHVVPSMSAWFGISWILLLQLLTVFAALMLCLSLGISRLFIPSLILVSLPLAIASAAARPLGTPLSYFGVLPFRLVLPLLLFLFVVWSVRRQGVTFTKRRSFLIGIVAGLATLNNLDFGLAAAVVAIGLMAVLQIKGTRLATLGIAVVGALTPIVTYALFLLVIQRPMNLEGVFVYTKVFGVEGYFKSPLPHFGIYIAVVLLFSGTCVSGARILMTATPGRGLTYVHGISMVLISAWSLLTFGYFVGRSYVPTLMYGFALQIGVCAALLFPIAAQWMKSNSVSRCQDSNAVLGALTTTAVVAICILASGLRLPSESLSELVGSKSATRQSDASVGAISQAQDLLRVAPDSRIGSGAQILPQANLTALTSSVKSVAAFNATDVLRIGPGFSTIQCSILGQADFNWLISDSRTLSLLREIPECERLLPRVGTQLFIRNNEVYALVQR